MKQYNIIDNVKEALTENDNKLSPEYINSLISAADVEYFHLTPTLRVCVITLQSGHEVLGKAQVLDPANDVAEIGNSVAYTNAVNEIWYQVGAIAKAVL